MTRRCGSLYVILVLGSAIAMETGCGRRPVVLEFPAGIVDQNLRGDMAFSPDGKSLAVANYDGLVKLADLRDGKADALPNPYERELSWHNKLAYSRDGRLLAVSYGQRAIVVWEMPGGRERLRIPLDDSFVGDLVFIDDDESILAMLLGFDNDRPLDEYGFRRQKDEAVKWELASGKRRGSVRLDRGRYISFYLLSPDGRHAVYEVTSDPGAPRYLRHCVFELTTGKNLFEVEPFGASVFSMDGSVLYTCADGRLVLRGVPSGRVLKQVNVPAAVRPSSVPHASLSSDGRLFAAGVGSYACIVSVDTGDLLSRVQCGPYGSICGAALLSPDGQIMATQRDTTNMMDQPAGPLLKLWRIKGPEGRR